MGVTPVRPIARRRRAQMLHIRGPTAMIYTTVCSMPGEAFLLEKIRLLSRAGVLIYDFSYLLSNFLFVHSYPLDPSHIVQK